MKKTVLIIAVAVAGMAGGIYVSHWQASHPTPSTIKPTTDQTSQLRPDFALLDTEGQPRSIKDWDGKVIMINFWATWCQPCRREMPALLKLYETYKDKGFVIVGVAIDDNQSVIDYIDPMGIEYPVLIGDQEGIYITKDYGNRLGVLPYTVVIDRKGKIVYRHRSEITYTEAEQIIRPLL
ncbi:MAG: TlpA family protein disulfide reductase [Proteobacteria bacterium]|jgi:peroxiredoxin|nr:TlpA family protein disulfide reductase [Pseudomonadota bacterium]